MLLALLFFLQSQQRTAVVTWDAHPNPQVKCFYVERSIFSGVYPEEYRYIRPVCDETRYVDTSVFTGFRYYYRVYGSLIEHSYREVITEPSPEVVLDLTTPTPGVIPDLTKPTVEVKP